jgi:hypothetical protein
MRKVNARHEGDKMIFDEPAYYDANRVLDCIKACEGMANPEKEIVALRAEVERKDKALAWYADHKNYVGDGSMVRIGNSLQTFKPILADHGGMARAALAPVVDEKRH